MLLIRLAPLLGSAAAGAALGFQLLFLIPPRGRSYLLIPFLVLFLAMTILEKEPGWNLALLLGFSLTAGLLLNWSGADAIRWGTWLLFLGCWTVGLIGAVILGRPLQKALKFLFPLTALYMLGWLGVILWDLPGWIKGTWVLSGLALFTVIAAGVLQRGFTLQDEESPVPLGIELWVILFNLFWLSAWIPLGG